MQESGQGPEWTRHDRQVHRGAEAPQCAAGGDPLHRFGLGARAGHCPARARTRCARVRHPLVPDRRGDRPAAVAGVFLALRVHQPGHQARERGRRQRAGRAHGQAPHRPDHHRRAGDRGGAAADRPRGRTHHARAGRAGRGRRQFHRRAAVRQPEQRQGPAVFLGRSVGGLHHRAGADRRTPRDQPQVLVRVPRQQGRSPRRSPASSASATCWRAACNGSAIRCGSGPP